MKYLLLTLLRNRVDLDAPTLGTYPFHPPRSRLGTLMVSSRCTYPTKLLDCTWCITSSQSIRKTGNFLQIVGNVVGNVFSSATKEHT